MTDEPIDLSSEPARDRGQPIIHAGRPFLGIHFACCGVYARIYLNASGSAFAGNCPRCGGRIEARISPDGESGQFFSVS